MHEEHGEQYPLFSTGRHLFCGTGLIPAGCFSTGKYKWLAVPFNVVVSYSISLLAPPPQLRYYFQLSFNTDQSLISSPEHEVLMVSYCDQSLSVVRALSTLCFKQLLLQNGLTDFEIILQEGSLGDPLPKLLKPFRSVEQDGRQS